MISQFKNQKLYIEQAIRNLKKSSQTSSLSTTSLLSNRISKQELPKTYSRNEAKFNALSKWDGEIRERIQTEQVIQHESSDEDLDLIHPDIINPFILDVQETNSKVDLMFEGIEPITLNSDDESFEEIELPAKLDLDFYE
jgi:hypothetical protein